MPCFLKPRSASLEMSGSSVGRTRSSPSKSRTSTPRRAYARAISVPEAPAPTTAIVAGSSSSAHASSVPMTRPPNFVPGIGRFTEPVATMTALAGLDLLPVEAPPTLTLPSAVSDAVALEDVDAVLLEEAGHAAGQRLDDLRAAGDHGAEVDRRLGDLDAELAGVAHLLQDVGRAQDRLGGDAGVVQAASADLVLLDHGGLHPELCRPDRGDVAAGARADDDES